MKWNWGTGIAAVYSLFVLVFVVLVFRATRQDNSLVTDEYYAEDLAYQQHYNKLVNARSLDRDLSIIEMPQRSSVSLIFPEGLEDISGEIQFFCPSDSALDFFLPVEVGADHRQHIPVGHLRKGLWKVKVNWQSGATPFYKETAIVL